MLRGSATRRLAVIAMRADPNEEGRPRAKERPLNVTTDNTHHDTECVRCERCSAPLSAAKSVERGLGPICCKAVA